MFSSLFFTVFFPHHTFSMTFLPLSLVFFYSMKITENKEHYNDSVSPWNWVGCRLHQGGMVITFETFETVGVRRRGLGNGIPKHEIVNTSKLIMCMDNRHGVFQRVCRTYSKPRTSPLCSATRHWVRLKARELSFRLLCFNRIQNF